jgi:insertion element IS1 protein InsB
LDVIATDGNYAYNKVINTHNIITADKKTKEKLILTKDCRQHIVSKKETCLVESYNSSTGDTFARFRRRTKCYSRSLEMVKLAMLIWSNIYIFMNILKNIEKTIFV